jgi:tryptophan synthase beta chain
LCARTEGIIPALESAHAVAGVVRKARNMRRDQIIVINLSGRGDKDMQTVANALGAGQ